MTWVLRCLCNGSAGLVFVFAATAVPSIAQSNRVFQNESSAVQQRNNTPARVMTNSNTLPQGVRAPGRSAGDTPATAPNTGSNIGRETSIPSLGGGLTIGGQTTGGSGNPASGPEKKRPGSTTTSNNAKTNPITPDEFGRQRQLDGLVNGRARRLREDANAANQNAPGTANGQDLVQGWQDRKNGLNPRSRPSRQSQQSTEGAGRKETPPPPKDKPWNELTRDERIARFREQRQERKAAEAETYARIREYERNGGVHSRSSFAPRGRPAPDAVDNTNPTRPASLQNTGTAPFNPVEARRNKKRQVTLPGENEARDANLNALAGRPLDSSYRVSPNIVNPVRDDGTSSTTPARGPGAAPTGSNRPGSSGGAPSGCTPDNPTC